MWMKPKKYTWSLPFVIFNMKSDVFIKKILLKKNVRAIQTKALDISHILQWSFILVRFHIIFKFEQQCIIYKNFNTYSMWVCKSP